MSGTGGGGKDAGVALPAPAAVDLNEALDPEELRNAQLATHGRLLFRASMCEMELDLPIVVQDNGFIADERVNNVYPRNDDIKSKHSWSIPPVDTFQIRGPNYLKDKVKYQADATPAFECVHVDMITAGKHATGNIAGHKEGYLSKQRKKGNKNFFMVVNFNAAPMHTVIYFEMPPKNYAMTRPNLRLLFKRFLEADEETRNKKFKVIPSIRKGSWVVKKAVGQKPAIIGKALTTTYHEVKNQYIEVDIDVNSSKVAQMMMSVVKGAAKDFVIDIGFLIEAQENDELPEMLLGTVRLHRPDTTRFSTLPWAPINDHQWREQQRNAGLKPPSHGKPIEEPLD